MKKKISILLCITLLFLTMFFNFDSKNNIIFSSSTNDDDFIKYQLIMPYFDIWKHSNGQWQSYNGQKSVMPGTVIKNPDTFPIVAPVGTKIKSIHYINPHISKLEYDSYKLSLPFNQFIDYRDFIINDCKINAKLKDDGAYLIGESKDIKIKLDFLRLDGRAKPLRGENQNKNVEGYRYFMAYLVEYDPINKTGGIKADFTNNEEVYEFQDIHFRDETTMWSKPVGFNEISKEEIIIEGINGTDFYSKLEREASEIKDNINPKIDFLGKGEYKITLISYDALNHEDKAYGAVKVKASKDWNSKENIDKLEVKAFANSPANADYGQVFKVNAENSVVKLPKKFAYSTILRHGLTGTPMFIDDYKIEIRWQIGSFKEGESFDESKMQDRPEYNNMFEFDYSVTDTTIADTYFRACISVNKQ